MSAARKTTPAIGINPQTPVAEGASANTEWETVAPALPQASDITRDHLGLLVFALRGGLKALYRPGEPMTEAALGDWIVGAQVGESILYHEGFLLLDRSPSASTLPAKERARIHALARRAWLACELGLVHLFSPRVGDGRYRYLAIRSGSTLKNPDIQARLRQPKAAPSTPATH